MILLVIIAGLALFFLAFMGLNKLGPSLFGFISLAGLLFGLYLLWSAFSSNDTMTFLWACVLLLGGAGTLMYLKTAFSD